MSDKFTVAAAFGNVHGVYKPGNVKLTPKILKNSQEYITEKYSVAHNHIDFVFHGGSGSSVDEIREAIDYGVIKMNIDTDLQYAYMTGARDYFSEKVYSTVIPRNVRLSEAPSHGMPVLIYDKSCPGSKSYFSFTDEFINQESKIGSAA